MSTLLNLAFSCLRPLPLSLSLPLIQLLFIIIILCLKRYRKEIGLNYERLVGRKGGWFWLKNISELGKNCALMLQIGKNSDKKLLDRIEIRGEDRLMRAYKEGRGVVVVSLHFGPWELLPQLFSELGYPVAIATQPQRNGWLGAKLLKIRQARPITITNRISHMRQVLKSGALLGFLLDNTSKTKRLAADWVWPGFRVLRTPFVLARLTGAPLVLMLVYKEGLRPVVEIGSSWAMFRQYLTRYPQEWILFGKGF